MSYIRPSYDDPWQSLGSYTSWSGAHGEEIEFTQEAIGSVEEILMELLGQIMELQEEVSGLKKALDLRTACCENQNQMELSEGTGDDPQLVLEDV